MDPILQPPDDSLFTDPEDEAVYRSFLRSTLWKRLIDVLIVRRGELFDAIGKHKAEPAVVGACAGGIDELQRLLRELPLRMVQYDRFKRGKAKQPHVDDRSTDVPLSDAFDSTP